MTNGSLIDLPTALALVRLRLMTEDAVRRADDPSGAGVQQALIALDGACEFALWLATQHAGIVLKNGDRASVPDLYSAARANGWQLSKAWPGVNQMHRARNDAQHAGVIPDRDQLPAWRDSTVAFIDSVTVVAFATRLEDISVVAAVRDPQIRLALEMGESYIAAHPEESFRIVWSAFETARDKWRGQRNAALPALNLRGPVEAVSSVSLTDQDPGRAIEELLEVQPFVGNLSDYVWLRRVSLEQSSTGWPPSSDDARRALVLVAGWVVRWEIFDQGYQEDRWEAYREGIEPPRDESGAPGEILWADVQFVPEITGRPARNTLLLQLANVPARGRQPWPSFLERSISDCVIAAERASSEEEGGSVEPSASAGRPGLPRPRARIRLKRRKRVARLTFIGFTGISRESWACNSI